MFGLVMHRLLGLDFLILHKYNRLWSRMEQKNQVWICQVSSMDWVRISLWSWDTYRGRMNENQNPWTAVYHFWSWKFLMFFFFSLHGVLWLLLPELIFFFLCKGFLAHNHVCVPINPTCLSYNSLILVIFLS